MGRIRTIKPEFHRSESLAQCSVHARLTYIGLWSEADDHGRGVANARALKGALWSLDDDVTWEHVEGFLGELERSQHIEIYEVAGKRYYEIRRWDQHQAASHRRGKPVHPASCGTLHANACKDVHDACGGVSELGTGNRDQGARGVAGVDGIDADFDTWWAEYPKQVEPTDAKRAYRKARSGGASEAELVAAARNYAQHVIHAQPEYVKLAKNFLNGESWRDYLEPVAAGPNAQERALGWDPGSVRS